MSNAVKQPSHYVEGRKYEPKDVIRDWGLNFNLGNAVKYLARAGRKDDIVQDLKKAQEYIQFEIDAIEEARSKSTPCSGFVGAPKAPVHNYIELEVPEGAGPEDIISAVITAVYNGGR